MAQAKRDENRATTLLGVDSTLFETPTTVAVDPVTHEVLVKPTSGAATSANQTTSNTYLAPCTTWVTTAVTLTTLNTAYLLPTTEQTGRKVIIIYNVSDTAVYIGTSSVTTTNGILLPAGGTMTLDAASGVYAICGTSGKIINVLEGK